MTAMSYVETIHGAEFSVVLKLEHNFIPRDMQLVCKISLDGQRATSILTHPSVLSKASSALTARATT
jgi:hypothetical protein